MEYNEFFRPQFHFTPRENWLNDPNGFWYNERTGEYHIYFQYVADYCRTKKENLWQKCWGHAVSSDLIHWHEEKIALDWDEFGGAWSGSAVVDKDNTSGLFPASISPGERVVVLYTSAKENDSIFGWQRQCLAWSEDGGYSFKKYTGNPVLPAMAEGVLKYDNRDPKVFWYCDPERKNGGVWMMVIAGLRARIFISDNLINWKYQSDMLYSDGEHIESECPDLFPLRSGEALKWIYSTAGRTAVIGEIVKDNGVYRFAADGGPSGPLNICPDMYALQTCYNAPGERRIGIYWMVDVCMQKIDDLSARCWDGELSLPFEFMLEEGEITAKPVKETDALREGDPVFIAGNVTLTSGNDKLLPEDFHGLGYEINAVFTWDKKISPDFGFACYNGNDCVTLCGYGNGELYVDKSRSGILTDAVYRGKVKADGKLNLKILVDNTILDVFANGAALNTVLFPYEGADGISFYVKTGSVTVEKIEIYKLSSIWNVKLI